MVLAPYPPLMEPPADNLESTAKETAKEVTRVTSLLSFVTSRQRGVLGAL